MEQGGQAYRIPIIPYDLRRDETVLQFTDGMEHLTNVSNDVFNRVNNRVSENKKKLEALTERIKIAEARIEKVRGSNKATQVFSCSKYPASEELEKYVSVFRNVEDSMREVKRSYHKIKSKHNVFEDNQLKAKMQFHPLPKPRGKSSVADQDFEGLGGLPSNIESLSSLLLFNSSENPYKKYAIFDPLGTSTKMKTAVEDENANDSGLGDAPMSISNREQMERHVAESYAYTPNLGDVPMIDVPMDLPNLEGIADVVFSTDLTESIAPSLISNLPDIPGIGDTPGSEVPPPPTPTGDVPPPPPPPQDVPPPPPPPPPPQPTAAPPPESSNGPPPAIKSVPEKVAAPSNNRSSLLESIRAAGGAGKMKLKSSKERKLNKKKEKEAKKVDSSSASGGGDLMSDLFSKLAMRRKGISGTKGASAEKNSNNNSDSMGGGSALDKISAMIPPPATRKASHTDDDDDWK